MTRAARLQDSVDTGRAARSRVPRRRLVDGCPGTPARSALEVLQAQDAERDETLLPIRYARMASSPWAYFRGAAAVMAADLARTAHTGLTVQLCGDAHVLNYGLWATPERNLAFDLRDFDETLPGPFEFDVKRLAASLIVCAEQNGLPETTGPTAVEAALTSYREHMNRYAETSELEVWYDRIDAEAPLASLPSGERRSVEAAIEKQAARRTNTGAFRKLTETRDGRRIITEAPPYRVHQPVGATPDSQQDIARQVYRTYLDSVPDQLATLLSRFTLTDVVRQVVGVGSVGMRVFLVLAEGRSGAAPLFLQIKQAVASVYEQHLTASAYPLHGRRVVVGQHLMQSATDLFAGWTRVEGLDFYVRQFRDMKIIPDGPTIAPFLPEFAASCGHALAKSHARSGDPAAIAAYIGRGTGFARAVGAFARAYAVQTGRDHADLRAAIADGRVTAAAHGW